MDKLRELDLQFALTCQRGLEKVSEAFSKALLWTGYTLAGIAIWTVIIGVLVAIL